MSEQPLLGGGGGLHVTVTRASSLWPVSRMVAVLSCVPLSSSHRNVFVYVCVPESVKSHDIPFVSSTFTEPLTTVGGGRTKSTFSFGPISSPGSRGSFVTVTRALLRYVAPSTGVNSIEYG